MMSYWNKNLIAWLSSVLVKLQVEVSLWQQGLCHRPVPKQGARAAAGQCAQRRLTELH